VGYVVRASRGRPGLTENLLVDLTEAAAIRSGVDLGVLTAGRRTIRLKDPIYEVTLVQHLVEYLLMYPALDNFDVGWEVRVGQKLVDIVLKAPRKSILVECKDFGAGAVNKDAKKLQTIQATVKYSTAYILAFWRAEVPKNIGSQVAKHYKNKRGLDPNLTQLKARKRFDVFAPEREHVPFGVALFKVL
jgi:hypothetical protein